MPYQINDININVCKHYYLRDEVSHYLVVYYFLFSHFIYYDFI